MLEVFCCPCLWIHAMVRGCRERNENPTSGSTNRSHQRQSRGTDNPLFTSSESGQHITIPTVNDMQGQGHHTRSRSQTRGKQYHLGALIELACIADRKTTQRHVDGLSVDGQGAEVHNLYHLYAVLSLAHQANNAKASQHYKEWSRLVSSGASTSRGRSDFYGLPTYEQAVALSHETNNMVDVNVLASNDSRRGSHAYIPPRYESDIPVNITIPTYEELMGINTGTVNTPDSQTIDINNGTDNEPDNQTNRTDDPPEEMHVNVDRNEELGSDVESHVPTAVTLPTNNDVCNESQDNSAPSNSN